ncbi:hypothetical protein J3T65_11430 [Staphylococcus simiae]|uniref:hypothetical protein n=1 Tax=Staphylococcus simiae TaxID=308354 RepID=UPI001A96F897|nr:hypothetical protein [Staphylococcus simiae]MBO1199949.1 hypothetical protein [Staphylococcus simiae]MBO1202211.1 hypothetical protein [Staphylococcus simiae]MBO1204480.1 hypothetical protein [Staphylococcus simiae]MBO1212032.1 hypothetical protein [Staphylococcus simiae]MBO1230654.1 hypothetical protein [Staphylococcus simiae]
MNKSTFDKKVKKQLWFLNKNEKRELDNHLTQLDDSESNHFNKPIAYSNEYLRHHVFNKSTAKSYNTFLLLLGIVFTYVCLLGLFLFGLITSLTGVQFFIQPKVDLSTATVILTIIGAILLMIVSIYLIKIVTAFFTKKLLQAKFNSK